MRKLEPVMMRQIRTESGKSRAQLAREAHMQAGTITWIEEGRFIPYDSQLKKIALALNVQEPEILLEPLEVK